MRFARAWAALALLLPLSWALHFVHKPRVWQALLVLVDIVVPARFEWAHQVYLRALGWEGRLERVIGRALQSGDA